MRSKFFPFILILFIITYGFSQSNKNYLIVENPFELNIYNKYEQNLTFNDSSIFLPFSPIEIIAEDTLLSDNYTPAFIGKIENQTFYFLKPFAGIPFSRLFDAHSNYIQNANSILDTINIIEDEKIIFYNAKDKRQKEFLDVNTKIVRVFTKGNQTYVKTILPPIQYGWSNLSNSKFWEPYQTTKAENEENILKTEEIIKNKLFSANQIIENLFTHFNQLNKKQIALPKWTLSTKENEFLCTLLNNENKFDFTESTNQLIYELQLSLASYNYSVFQRSNAIFIQKKKRVD